MQSSQEQTFRQEVQYKSFSHTHNRTHQLEPKNNILFWMHYKKENINGFERKVGEDGVHDCIRVPSLDQLRNLDPGDEGYIKCLPVYYEVKKKYMGKKQRRILSRGEKKQLRNNRVASL